MLLSEIDINVMLTKIEYLLAEKKMSKKEFYEKSGVSSSLYSQYNTGTIRPTWKSIGKMAEALDVSVKYLIGEPENEKSPSEEDELADELQSLKDDPDARAVLKRMKRMKPEEIRILRQWLEMNDRG